MKIDPRIDYQKLADRVITQLHDLVEDISTEQVQVANREYARNALHLLRDALLDLNALHVLVHDDLITKQRGLIDVQIEERIFHGPNHAAYHRNGAQIRAVIGSGHQHAKRLLNQCAYVTDAFVAHGSVLRSGSFGRQYASLPRLDRSKITDARSHALVALLEERGPALEIGNNYRDDYIEHVKPQRTGMQIRPATSGPTVSHHEAPTIQEVDGHVEQIEPGWVHMRDRSDTGVLLDIFYIHAKGAFKEHLPPSDETFLGVLLESDIMTRGHFRHTEYHMHTWVKQRLEDDSYGRIRLVSVSESDFDEVFASVVAYARDLVAACRITPG